MGARSNSLMSQSIAAAVAIKPFKKKQSQCSLLNIYRINICAFEMEKVKVQTNKRKKKINIVIVMKNEPSGDGTRVNTERNVHVTLNKRFDGVFSLWARSKRLFIHFWSVELLSGTTLPSWILHCFFFVLFSCVSIFIDCEKLVKLWNVNAAYAVIQTRVECRIDYIIMTYAAMHICFEWVHQSFVTTVNYLFYKQFSRIK